MKWPIILQRGGYWLGQKISLAVEKGICMEKLKTGWGITAKMLALVGLLLGVGIFSCINYQLLVNKVQEMGADQTTTTMMEDHKRELKNLVDAQALSLGAAIKGLQNEEQIQQAIFDSQKSVLFGPENTGYFFVYTKDGVNIVMAPKPEARGKSFWDVKDQKGLYLFREMAALAKNGGGFLEYYWDKPGKGVQPKMSYVRQIPGTSDFIGYGVYIDDVETEKGLVLATMAATAKSYLTTLGITVSLALVLVVVLTVMLVRSIVRPVKILTSVAQNISIGKLNVEIPGRFGGELEILKSAMLEMVQKMRQRAQVAGAIADGNLTMDVKVDSSDDELGQSLKAMTHNLNEVLGEVQHAASQISSGSAQVSDTSQSLSQGATESAASIEEITSSMTEMASQTRLNADNASQANRLASEVRRDAEDGNSRMQQMVGAMAQINESGQNISRIIKVIDEIAFQTNLLALNAAVEAARAGQHGKGFAVVAEEVRNLAARSAKAAQETAELIDGSVKAAHNGAEIAEGTAEALEKIVGGIAKVTDLVAEIAAASDEQAQGIGQVEQGLGQIDQVTQQNTASAEESAAAAEELASQASQLQHLLTRFELKHQSHALPMPSPPPVTSGDSSFQGW